MANRKISDLTALTAPATGDLLPIVDISEAAAADKNKKITFGELFASIPAGTAAAPSVAFEGDSNTGIYSPGADQLAISTNGTGRLFVDASGNVGVGTNNPVAKLVVEDSAALKIAVLRTATAIVGLGVESGPYIYSDGALQFRVGATQGGSTDERARIDTSGRLLVGTSSDSGGALFQVNGDRIRIGTAKTPASATATGTTGEIAWDANYIYVCTATNTWKRVAIATW